jgi:large subunit ribosomal protein L25
MAERAKLVVEKRDQTGTKRVEALRRDGKVPAVVYGHKKDTLAVTLNAHDFNEGLHHGHRLFDLDMEGKKETTMVKDLQYDYLGKEVIHADLIRVDLTEKVEVQVAVILKGDPKGAEEGGIVDQHLDTLEIECEAGNIPEAFEVSVKELEVGDSIHASDVELPGGVKLITEPEALIANCHLVAEIEEPEEGEEVAAEGPEVIGEEEPAAEEGGGEPEEDKPAEEGS